MKRRILDSNILIAYWKQKAAEEAATTTQTVQTWAKELISHHQTDAIVTPVYAEVIAGVQSKRELQLTQEFLRAFVCVDGRRILAQDWAETIRIAQRVPRNGKPRQLGDCLIRAIANRLRYEVETDDKGFPK